MYLEPSGSSLKEEEEAGVLEYEKALADVVVNLQEQFDAVMPPPSQDTLPASMSNRLSNPEREKEALINEARDSPETQQE